MAGIVGVARTLGITVIAEGIETREEATMLRSAGIALFQGYLFAKPAVEHLPEMPGLSALAHAA